MLRIAAALTALAALATAAPAPQSSRGLTTGSLTWYTEGIGQAFTACGTMNTLTDVSNTSNTIISESSVSIRKPKTPDSLH